MTTLMTQHSLAFDAVLHNCISGLLLMAALCTGAGPTQFVRRNAGLRAVPSNIPETVVIVDLESNSIRDIGAGAFRRWEQ